jgi:epoxyqueuosine reductase
MNIEEQIKELLTGCGCEFGFAKVDDGPEGLPFAISIAVPLSDAVIDEIDGAPTYSYFHHYRTVNAYIDRILLQTGLLLQSRGYRYIPIAASQSVPQSQSIPSAGERSHMGRYSHKKAAVLAGLGSVGKNSLFLHHTHGPRVRLGTLFTDCPLTVTEHRPAATCVDCDLCVKACPAGAITGAPWREGIERSEMFDANACNNYMRDHFMSIGRGSVCGICIKVCPLYKR